MRNKVANRQASVHVRRPNSQFAIWCLALAASMLVINCGDGSSTSVDPTPTPDVKSLPPSPLFDPDSAYAFVAKQVSFGPRVPGTDAHRACGDWMATKMKNYGATVHEQIGSVKAFNGKQLPLRNIIAQWQPQKSQRILLFAHWDTRPFADKDKERVGQPIDGANDGGSGVGILMELARHLSNKPTELGVDIIFFDVEDYGQPSEAMGMDENSIDTWCLGSRYWAKNLVPAGYSARFGILLDMCGAKDAKFYQEANSMKFASNIVRKVWGTGKKLGYGDRFIAETKYYVGIDDHVIVNEQLNIPSIDIIEFYADGNGFHPSWHTHQDNMDVIDPATLKAVGQTVMEVVWKER